MNAMTDSTKPYKPSSEKPWRVVWGFGAFEDFATYGEAFEKYTELGSTRSLRVEPFNAVTRFAHQP
jgi:hypothetical protein